MRNCLEIIWFAVLFFVPRFVTEDVALEIDGDDEYSVVCPMALIEDGERYDAVVTATSFIFMFWGWAVRIESEIRPWPETNSDGEKQCP